MSMFSDLFKAPGEDAANAANKRNGKIAGKYGKLFDEASNDYRTLHSLFSGDNAMAGFRTALNALNQDPGQRVQQFGNGANEAAAQQAQQSANFLRTQGFGDGAIMGAGQGAFQNAATQTNQYAQQQYDPQEMLRQFMAYLQAQQGAEGGALSALQGFGSGVYGAPAPVVGQNPLAGILGQAVGAYASASGAKAGR